MKINSDILTTAGGVVLATLTASQPIVAAVDGSFKQGDWVKLILAIVFAVQGFFTNRQVKPE